MTQAAAESFAEVAAHFRESVILLINASLFSLYKATSLGGTATWEHMDAPDKGEQNDAERRWAGRTQGLAAYLLDARSHIKDQMAAAVDVYRLIANTQAIGGSIGDTFRNGVADPSGYQRTAVKKDGTTVSTRFRGDFNDERVHSRDPIAKDTSAKARAMGAKSDPKTSPSSSPELPAPLYDAGFRLAGGVLYAPGGELVAEHREVRGESAGEGGRRVRQPNATVTAEFRLVVGIRDQGVHRHHIGLLRLSGQSDRRSGVGVECRQLSVRRHVRPGDGHRVLHARDLPRSTTAEEPLAKSAVVGSMPVTRNPARYARPEKPFTSRAASCSAPAISTTTGATVRVAGGWGS